METQSKYINIFKGLDVSIDELLKDASDVIIKLENEEYHNLTTGKSGSLDEIKRNKTSIVVFNRYQKTTIGYFCYHNKEEDVIVFKFVKIDTLTNPKKNEKRKWEFVSKNDEIACCIVDKHGNYYRNNIIALSCFVDFSTLDCYGDYLSASNHSHHHLIATLRGFFGNMFYDHFTQYLPFDDIRNIVHLFTSPQNKEISKNEKKYNDIINIPLKPISKKEHQKMRETFNNFMKFFSNNDNRKDICDYYKELWQFPRNVLIKQSKIEKINETTSVIRIFCTMYDALTLNVMDNEKPENGDICEYEGYRIYITDTTTFVCQKFFNRWNVLNDELPVNTFYTTFFCIEEDAINNCKLKYFSDEIKEVEKNGIEDKTKSMHLLASITNVLYEKFIKSGLNNFIKDAPENFSAYEQLSYMFGGINKYENDFSKAVKAPFYLVKKVNSIIDNIDYDCSQNYFYSVFVKNIVKSLKKLYKDHTNYFLSMNNDQLDTLIKYLIEYYNIRKLPVVEIGPFELLIKVCGHKNLIGYLDAYCDLYESLKCTQEEWNNVYHHFWEDCMYMLYAVYENMDKNSIRYRFKNAEELRRYHDNLTALYNIKHTNCDISLYNKKLKEKEKHFKYFSFNDDKFTITYPKEYLDIVNEGILLNHCVRSYAEAIIKGKTNILFIRKNEELDKPFFTLEIRDKKIRQCHGYNNCNVDTVEGLDAFLKKFCDEKNIKYNCCNELLAV